MKAQKLGRYRGRNVCRYPVRRRLADGGIYRDQTDLPTIHVVAHSAADAAAWALKYTLARVTEPCEVTAVGPRGGETLRYAGWHSVIANELVFRPRPTGQQLVLGLL